MGVGVAEETGFGRVSQHRLDNRQGDQLGVGQFRSYSHHGPVGNPMGVSDQQIVYGHVQCGSEGVQVRVHTRSSGIGKSFTPPDSGHPHPQNKVLTQTPLGTNHLAPM